MSFKYEVASRQPKFFYNPPEYPESNKLSTGNPNSNPNVSFKYEVASRQPKFFLQSAHLPESKTQTP